jgi:uncharacterized membrane protein
MPLLALAFVAIVIVVVVVVVQQDVSSKTFTLISPSPS